MVFWGLFLYYSKSSLDFFVTQKENVWLIKCAMLKYLMQILKLNEIFVLLDSDVDPYHVHPVLRHHFLLWKWTPHNDRSPHGPNCLFLSIWVRITQRLFTGTLPHGLSLQCRTVRLTELHAPGYRPVSVLFPFGKFI
jgi:hypothetical protein